MYNVILFGDCPNPFEISRSYGIQILASELRKHGFSVLCVNFISTLSPEMYKEIIKTAVGENTFFVGFSTTWLFFSDLNEKFEEQSLLDQGYYSRGEHDFFYESVAYNFILNPQPFCDEIKKQNPKTKIVVGGPKSYEYVECPHIDHVFVGLSENMIVDFANSFVKKNRRLFNKVINHDMKAQIGNFDLKKTTVEYCADDVIVPNETLNIEFGRGCIFSCTFCDFPLIGNKNVKDYIKTKDIIYRELLDNYTKWGVSNYYIVDDTFNDSVEKLEVIAAAISMLPFKPKFWCFVRIDLIASHPKMAQLLLDIGVVEVTYGLETLHEEAGRIIKKGNPEKKLKGIKMANEVWKDKITIQCGVIVGLPKEPSESIINTVKWFVNEGIKYNIVEFSLQPLAIQSNKNNFAFLSEFERNPEKYGFTCDGINWTKDDGTDIRSIEDAINLAAHLQETYLHHRTDSGNGKMMHRKAMSLSMYSVIDDSLQFDNLMKLSKPELADIMQYYDAPTAYKKWADTQYWPRIFALLYKKKQEVKQQALA